MTAGWMEEPKIRTSGGAGEQEGRFCSSLLPSLPNTLLPPSSGDVLIYGPRRYRGAEFHFHVAKDREKAQTEEEKEERILSPCHTRQTRSETTTKTTTATTEISTKAEGNRAMCRE